MGLIRLFLALAVLLSHIPTATMHFIGGSTAVQPSSSSPASTCRWSSPGNIATPEHSGSIGCYGWRLPISS
jgi:hypothetical protein